MDLHVFSISKTGVFVMPRACQQSQQRTKHADLCWQTSARQEIEQGWVIGSRLTSRRKTFISKRLFFATSAIYFTTRHPCARPALHPRVRARRAPTFFFSPFFSLQVTVYMLCIILIVVSAREFSPLCDLCFMPLLTQTEPRSAIRQGNVSLLRQKDQNERQCRLALADS